MPTVTDPHVAPNPIDAMSDVDALRTIMSYLQGVAVPAAQLPQAASDMTALLPPSGGSGGAPVLVSPLDEALLPVESTYAAVFPQGNLDVPSHYARRLATIVSRLGGQNGSLIPYNPGLHLPNVPGSGVPSYGGGDGGATPTPPATTTTKPSMTWGAAATGLVIVAAGAGAIWYMHQQRTTPRPRAREAARASP